MTRASKNFVMAYPNFTRLVLLLLTIWVCFILIPSFFWNKFPRDVELALLDAENVDLVSIEPLPKGRLCNNLQDFPVLGKFPVLGATALDRAEKESLVSTMWWAQVLGGGLLGCVKISAFRPRHGLRVVSKTGRIYEIILDFQCGYADVYADGNQIAELSTLRFPRATANQLLKAHNIPISTTE